MDILSWKANIEFEASENTNPANLSIKISGNGCSRNELAEKVKNYLVSAMNVLGNDAELSKEKEKRTQAEQKLKVLEDANKAFELKQREIPKAEEIIEQVEQETKKRKNRQ